MPKLVLTPQPTVSDRRLQLHTTVPSSCESCKTCLLKEETAETGRAVAYFLSWAEGGAGRGGRAKDPVYCTAHNLVFQHRTPNEPYYLQAQSNITFLRGMLAASQRSASLWPRLQIWRQISSRKIFASWVSHNTVSTHKCTQLHT